MNKRNCEIYETGFCGKPTLKQCAECKKRRKYEKIEKCYIDGKYHKNCEGKCLSCEIFTLSIVIGGSHG